MSATNQSTMLQEAGEQTQLQGRLDFDTVPELWKSLHRQIRNKPDLTLDLSQVKYADSAALALLLQVQEEVNQQSGKLILQNIPEDLLDLARLSNADGILKNST